MKNLKNFAILSIFCLFLSSCCCLNTRQNTYSSFYKEKDDLVAIQKKSVVRIGVKRHAPPFSQKNSDQSLVGFDVDLAKSISNELGVKCELIPLDSKDRVPFLKNNRVDLVIATMTATRKREQAIDFSIPYFEDGQGLICRKDSSIQSYSDLKNKKIGAAAGTTSYLNMQQVQPECKMVAFKNYNAGVKALLLGQIDAFTGDYLVLKGLQLNHEQSSALELRGNRFTVEPYGVALRENQSNLRDSVNRILKTLWNNGTWSKIHSKWLGKDSAYKSNDNFTMKTL